MTWKSWNKGSSKRRCDQWYLCSLYWDTVLVGNTVWWFCPDQLVQLQRGEHVNITCFNSGQVAVKSMGDIMCWRWQPPRDCLRICSWNDKKHQLLWLSILLKGFCLCHFTFWFCRACAGLLSCHFAFSWPSLFHRGKKQIFAEASCQSAIFWR